MDYSRRIEEITGYVWSVSNTKEINDQIFNGLIQELNEMFTQSNDYKCLWLISELYIHKANSNKKHAVHYATEAMNYDCHHGGLHDNFNIASNGINIDFKKQNHHHIIEYYNDFIKHHPDSLIARRILIENLIDNYRLEEAEQELMEAYKIAGNKLHLVEFYEGEIQFKKGLHKDAIKLWENICVKYPNYESYFTLADEYAKVAMYDKAIYHYRKSFDMQVAPRRIDALISLVQVYEIKKDYQEALNVTNEILEVYKDDYNDTSSDEVKPYVENQKRLSALLERKL